MVVQTALCPLDGGCKVRWSEGEGLDVSIPEGFRARSLSKEDKDIVGSRRVPSIMPISKIIGQGVR